MHKECETIPEKDFWLAEVVEDFAVGFACVAGTAVVGLIAWMLLFSFGVWAILVPIGLVFTYLIGHMLRRS